MSPYVLCDAQHKEYAITPQKDEMVCQLFKHGAGPVVKSAGSSSNSSSNNGGNSSHQAWLQQTLVGKQVRSGGCYCCHAGFLCLLLLGVLALLSATD